MYRRFIRLTAVLLLVAGWGATAQPAAADEHPYAAHVPAPPLEGGVGWLNTAEPLTLESLRGKFVLLDFWTYCCINCFHVLPELKKLERAFPNELVVVGVHSAKFTGERQTENIREAILRYEIEHPVVNDAKLTIWRRYGIRSWPTMVLIDPVGDAVWIGAGEQRYEDLRKLLEQGIPYYRQRGLLDTTVRKFRLEADRMVDTPLRFPGKVLADAPSGRLFIADSNHNQIVIADLAGKGQERIGSGEIGSADGTFETASFNHPQGMALVGDSLFVADTENHLIRRVDLTGKQVSTVAGTGKQARPGEAAGRGAISSPWDLLYHNGVLYIAMAGPHQIWQMHINEKTGRIGRAVPYAGNGVEDIADGPLLPRQPYQQGFASFAQPSGLATDGRRLFVADSEGSAIRSVPFGGNGEVTTLVGPVRSLFDFGDADGVARRVRLQHPLGVAYGDGLLYVADTYNNKIKVIDLETRACRTLAGSGQAGHADSDDPRKATFDEPGGLAVAAGKLFVADTNNHIIRVVDLERGNRVETVTQVESGIPQEER